MKVMSVIRFKPKPENYDEFIDVQTSRNAKKGRNSLIKNVGCFSLVMK